MKLLHTSDWHLGKKLEGHSRLEEQGKFIEELIEIANKEEINIVIIAGDIFDMPSPSAEAEHLYFSGIKELSKGGERAVIVIAGNHDSSSKITASEPLAREHGILSFGKPLEKKETGVYGKFEVKESFAGGVLLEINGKEVFINALPYASSKTLEEYHVGIEEGEISHSQKIGEVLYSTHKNVKKGCKSIIVAHLFTLGAESSGEERNIELGGSLAFNLSDAPNCDYIALGHIHKPMIFSKYNAVYSGSNLEYRSSEAKFRKKVFIKDLESSELKEIVLDNYKPIKEYTALGISEAIEISENLKNEEQWIYLTIKSDRPLKNNEIKDIKKNKNIIMIIPDIEWEESQDVYLENYSAENITEAFKVFYKNMKNEEIEEATLDAFLELIGDDV